MGKVDKVYHRMGALKLAILSYLATSHDYKRNFEIAKAVGVPRPQVMRSLKTMEDEGLVKRIYIIEWAITDLGLDELEAALDERRKRAETNKRRANDTLDQIDKLTTT